LLFALLTLPSLYTFLELNVFLDRSSKTLWSDPMAKIHFLLMFWGNLVTSADNFSSYIPTLRLFLGILVAITALAVIILPVKLDFLKLILLYMLALGGMTALNRIDSGIVARYAIFALVSLSI